MKRETVNKIRFFIEDVLPPIIRDSALFRELAKLAWGSHIERLAHFRARAPFLTAKEYEQLYRDHPRVHDGTDNSEACIRRIIRSIQGTSVCDIGCGTGALLRRMRDANSGLTRIIGVDFVHEAAGPDDGIRYVVARIEALPFADGEFDTVVCTHVIEHLLDSRLAITELRRIAKEKLIIVVPREREYYYTFNPHFNFFPYTHSFLRAAHPVPPVYVCEDIGRDIYYEEARDGAAKDAI